jgi:hypothetical protein
MLLNRKKNMFSRKEAVEEVLTKEEMGLSEVSKRKIRERKGFLSKKYSAQKKVQEE